MNKIDQAYKEILENMMSIAGYDLTYEDLLKEEDGWWARYTMTQEQRERWKKESVKVFRQKLRWPKWKSEEQVKWIDLMWGLKVEEKD